jgi:hypothetical protein
MSPEFRKVRPDPEASPKHDPFLDELWYASQDYGIVWIEVVRMSTLYESLCADQLERIRMDNETEEQCKALAVSLVTGIGRELSAPEGMFGLIQRGSETVTMGIPGEDEFPKSVGFLAWEFRFALSLTHPNGNMLLGTYWGDFTIRRQLGAQAKQWGVLEWGGSEYELSYPTPDSALIRQLAIELSRDVSSILLKNRSAKTCQIGFIAKSEE